MQFEELSFDVVPALYENKDDYFKADSVDLKSVGALTSSL